MKALDGPPRCDRRGGETGLGHLPDELVAEGRGLQGPWTSRTERTEQVTEHRQGVW